MLANKEYIWLYRTTRFGRIINRWDRVSLDEDNIKTCVLKHADEAVRAFYIIEQLVFPVKGSRLLDAYRADNGETFFVCVKKKNNSTVWEQFNSPDAAKKYISSMRILKEIYIFSSKDMIVRV